MFLGTALSLLFIKRVVSSAMRYNKKQCATLETFRIRNIMTKHCL